MVSAPSQDTLRVTVYGRKAHAGAEPEKGINAIRVASEAIAAMPLGRIDEETTVNIGVIQGGTATNIVPDEVLIRGEAAAATTRSWRSRPRRWSRPSRTPQSETARRVEVKIQRSYNSYALTEETPIVAKTMAAIQKLGQTPVLRASGGGTDGNIYAEHGIYCCVISTGMSQVHTTNENIAISAMVAGAQLLQDIVAAR